MIFLSFSILVLRYISNPLLSIHSTETDPSILLDFNVNKSTEFDLNKKSFWWLTMDENIITIMNRGDESVKFDVNLIMSQNPCETAKDIEIEFLTNKRIYEIKDKEKTTISLGKFIFKPFENLVLNIKGRPGFNCKIKNGDVRNFLVKLEKVEFIYEK